MGHVALKSDCYQKNLEKFLGHFYRKYKKL